MNIEAFRRNDSIFFSLANLDSLPYRYELYEGNKLIADAMTLEKWQWFRPDDNDQTYRLEYIYPYGKTRLRGQKLLPPLRKLLNISVSQAEKINPGEKVTTEITVTDAEGQPVPDVNLTAFGVNAQFDWNNVPEVPWLEIFPTLRTDYYESSWKARPKSKSEDESIDPIDLMRYRLSDSVLLSTQFSRFHHLI